MKRSPVLMVDRTHVGRRASGIERITEELFSSEALSPLPVVAVEGPGASRLSIAAAQMIRLPLSLLSHPRTLWAFSGYPPSPLATLSREQCVMYVHDMFLITRNDDLNRAARIYMSLPFRLAIRRLRYFLVNSLTTGRALAPYVRADAVILPYRPRVRNVFGLSPSVTVRRDDTRLVLGAIGTVEPRKNLLAAAAIVQQLGERMQRKVELHVIGRSGWGGDFEALGRLPHVKLLGFLTDEEACASISSFDALICTSHDEGLGLPLIEAQYAGLQVIAPDQPVFREVLGASGLYIDPAHPETAAERIAGWAQDIDRRCKSAASAESNTKRWNAIADRDRAAVVQFLSTLLDARRTGQTGHPQAAPDAG